MSLLAAELSALNFLPHASQISYETSIETPYLLKRALSVHRKLNDGTWRFFLIVLGQLLDSPFLTKPNVKGAVQLVKDASLYFFCRFSSSTQSQLLLFGYKHFFNFSSLLKKSFKVKLPTLNWLTKIALGTLFFAISQTFNLFSIVS